MQDVRKHLKEGLLTGALVLAVVLCLPLVALLVFLGRIAFIVVAAVAFVGGIALFVFSPRFRAWFRDSMSPLITYKGLRLATDVSLHRGHCWARIEPDEIVVGADDLVQAVLGPVESVETPLVGARIQKGEPLLRLWCGSRSLDLPAPVSGTVRGINTALRGRPGLVNEDPFSKGWMVRIDGKQPRQERRSLLNGASAVNWFRREVDRLIAALQPGWAAAPSLPDGGAVVDNLYRHIDDETWGRIRSSFFEGRESDAL